MYQSEITIGMRVSWSSSHASRPFAELLTSYPPARARAPNCALDTGSSSTTRTVIALGIVIAFRRIPKVFHRQPGRRLHPLQPGTRGRDVTVVAGRLHLLEQRGEVPRADRGGGRLERMGGALNRLGSAILCGGHQRLEPLRHRLHEGGDNAVHGLLGP